MPGPDGDDAEPQSQVTQAAVQQLLADIRLRARQHSEQKKQRQSLIQGRKQECFAGLGVAAGFLSQRRELSGLVKWKAVPSPCLSFAAVTTPAEACENVPDANIASLSKAWEQRHAVVVGVPTADVPNREARCYKIGFCICSGRGVYIQKFWMQVMRNLKLVFGNDRSMLSESRCCLLFRASVCAPPQQASSVASTSLSQGASSFSEHYVHIALQYYRPWRPTFLRLQVVGQHSAQGDVPASMKDTSYQECRHVEFEAVLNERGAPEFCSPHSFIDGLDLDCSFKVSRLSLSQSLQPWMGSNGRVRAHFLQEPPVLVWSGMEEERKREPRRQAPAGGGQDGAGGA